MLHAPPDTVPILAGVGGVLLIPIAAVIALLILCIHWKMRQRKRQLEFIREVLVILATVFLSILIIIFHLFLQINDDPIFRMGPRKVNPLLDEPGLTTDDWEIPASQIIIDESLGEGAFGEVYKGVITEPISNPRVCALLKQNYSSFVAVKLLKGEPSMEFVKDSQLIIFTLLASATGNERTDFLSEIEMMKKIAEGNNPHVVNMMGCVTIQEPLCLITEFVKYGDLQSYLRTNRKLVSSE